VSKAPSLSSLLIVNDFPILDKKNDKALLEDLQLKMLRIQQGLWHQQRRAIIVFEGFDAAGKGGVIRRMVENLDPRGIEAHSIGPPSPEEQKRHYLYRFWRDLPKAGCVAIFDRSWYGRVLVERVEKLTPKERWKAAYGEIKEFETMLQDDGIELIKFFLAIDKDEQLRRFEQRLHDPYKQWKLTQADVEARSKWNEYVAAVDDMFQKTHTERSPWHLIPANDKHYARRKVLITTTTELSRHAKWVESKAQQNQMRSLKAALHDLGVKKM
jgi:AMP-polyphosphate phosphotransferase